jgi:hypothetical protein
MRRMTSGGGTGSGICAGGRAFRAGPVAGDFRYPVPGRDVAGVEVEEHDAALGQVGDLLAEIIDGEREMDERAIGAACRRVERELTPGQEVLQPISAPTRRPASRSS